MKLMTAGAMLILIFALLHALGMRENAAILSGSPASSPAGGVAYVLAYFGALLVAPILIGAGAVIAVAERLARARSRR